MEAAIVSAIAYLLGSSNVVFKLIGVSMVLAAVPLFIMMGLNKIRKSRAEAVALEVRTDIDCSKRIEKLTLMVSEMMKQVSRLEIENADLKRRLNTAIEQGAAIKLELDEMRKRAHEL